MNAEQEVLTPEVLIAEANAPMVSPGAEAQLLAVCAPRVQLIEEYTAKAGALQVRTPDEAQQAKGLMAQINADGKAIMDAISTHKANAQARHKLWTTFENRFIEPFRAAREAIKAKVIKYDEEQKAMALAEARRLQAIADEKARRERERQEQEAAAARAKEEDARQAAEKARRDAEAASGAERARLEAEARKKDREAAAAAAKAEVKQEAAATVIAPVIEVKAQKSGVRARSDVTVEIVDIKAFVRQAAEETYLCGYIDQPSLAANLKRAKSANKMLTIPGVKFGEKTV